MIELIVVYKIWSYIEKNQNIFLFLFLFLFLIVIEVAFNKIEISRLKKKAVPKLKLILKFIVIFYNRIKTTKGACG